MDDDTAHPSNDTRLDARIDRLGPLKRALLAHMSAATDAPPAEARAVKVNDQGGPVELSYAQQRLWFLEQWEGGGALYNMVRGWWLQGPLEVARLRGAVGQLIARHESLRTVFVSNDGEPRQQVLADLAVDVPLVDLGALPEEQARVQALAQAQALARQGFDLAQGPLVRLTLFRVAESTHLLVLVMHHIISDGWSMGVFCRELAALYAGHGEQLPALPMQYADYALWQREMLEGATLERQLAYWRPRLAGVTTLELPTDRPRPPVLSYRGARHPVALSPGLTAALKQLSQRERVTLYMLLLAAFQVLLARHSGQDDIAVGSPIAGRTRSEFEGLIGFFVNTLVLRTDLSGNPRFSELLARVRESALDAYAHQDVPFEKLVAELKPPRDLSRSPLFQLMFVLQNAPGGELALPNLEVKAQELDTATAKFDLTLTLSEGPAGLYGELEYATDLFDAATIARMVGHFTALLEDIVARPQTPIDELAVLATAERMARDDGSETEADYPRDRCIHQLFEEQAARTSEAVAVIFEDRQLTYADLNARANQLAHQLIRLGVRPEVLVGLCMERSLDLIVGILGVLKAGGAYVPLDPSYPAQRLVFMLADTQAPVLLTQAPLLDRLPDNAAHILCLDRDWQTIAAQADSNPPCHATAENLAYIIYTSGSTGTPKGVMMPHRPICNLTWWQMRTSAVLPGTRTLQLAPAGFDVSVQEIFSTLCAGGTLVLLSDRARRDPIELLEVIENASVARLFLTFSALQQLAEAALARQRAPSNLREVMTAGEQLRITPAIARWFDALPECRLYNQYGPTETHVVVTHSALEGPSRTWPALPPIGWAISNTRIYILDDNLRPVPAGATGEIVIGGDCLARGYLNRPQLSAERFVADPFAGEAGARMYRSGDFGRFRDDGSVEFHGRRDHQVKVRGFRIEIGEVEAAIDQHPDVARAAVTVYEPDPGDRRLVAYVETRHELALGADVLRTFLLDKLPEYMVPAMFVQLATLPISPTGKIDRQALPPPPPIRPPMATDYVAPSAALEKRLLEIWQDLLALGEIGVDDNFFALGGDSLMATRLISRIETAFDRRTSYRDLFSNPTIRGLASALARIPCAAAATQMDVSMPAAPGEPLPATPEQEAIWLAGSLQPALPVYNESFALHFNGTVDPDLLQSALNKLIVRHDILRTGFVAKDGQLVQKIALEGGLRLAVLDVRHAPVEDAWKTAASAAESTARVSFDLARPPLMRGVLARMPDSADVLFLTMHHLVIDAFGFYRVLVPELAALYEESRKGGNAALLEHPLIQFSDFARWRQRQLADANGDELRAFWRTQLADLAPLELPSDRTRPPVRSFRGEFLAFSVAQQTASALKELAARDDVTLFTVLVAAFKALLYRYTGQTDIGIRTVDAGRVRPEHEALLGCCASSLILRTSLDADLSFRELLRRVRDSTTSALEHRALPFLDMADLLPQGDACGGHRYPWHSCSSPACPNVPTAGRSASTMSSPVRPSSI